MNWYRELGSHLISALRTPPTRGGWRAWWPALIYFVLALLIGWAGGILRVEVVPAPLLLTMPFVLVLFPSLMEELLFRGCLIPNDTRQRGRGAVLGYSLLSVVLFVAWHPLQELTFNPTPDGIFINPVFLLIVALLGGVCAWGYIVSRSLWVPVIIHWLTVVVWVLFLDGRNMLLEQALP